MVTGTIVVIGRLRSKLFRIYAYANRFDPGQPPSILAAGLRINLFTTQSIIPNKNQAKFKGFKKQTTI